MQVKHWRISTCLVSGQQGYVDVDRELPTVPEAEGEEEEDSGSEGGEPIPPPPAV